MTMSPELVRITVDEARKKGVEPAALLAVVEIESDGKALEPADGRTPQLLFERHIFYRQLKIRVPNKLSQAVVQGLANATWQPSTQYKDQGTSAKRLALLKQARAIDEECADRACSWGLGQTMGFLAPELGYESAISMVDTMTRGGIPVQLDMMIGEMTKHKLVAPLNNHDWVAFAKGYNGPGYARNHYDTRLQAAYMRWKVRLDQLPALSATPTEDDKAKVGIPKKTAPPAATAATGTVVAGIGTMVSSHWVAYVIVGAVILAGLTIWLAKRHVDAQKPAKTTIADPTTKGVVAVTTPTTKVAAPPEKKV